MFQFSTINDEIKCIGSGWDMLILFLKHLYLDNLWEIKKDFNRQVIRIAHVRVHSLSMLITKVLLSFKLHCAANFFSNDDHDDDGISLLRIRMYTCIKRKLCSLCYTTPSNPPSFHQSLSWVIITIKFRTHSWQAKMHCSGMSSRCVQHSCLLMTWRQSHVSW